MVSVKKVMIRGIQMNALLEFAWIVVLYMVVSRIFGRILQTRVKPSTKKESRVDELEKKIDLAEEIRSEEERIVEMVMDECCGAYIPKDKAYQIVDEDGHTHYFCGWDCRQKYVLEHR
jgi:YHS domain-containing protein